MAEGQIRVPPDSTGSRIRTETHTEGADTVHQEVVTLALSDGTLIALTDLSKAVGDLANDAADSGNPVKIGGQARSTNPTAVADADRVNALFDLLGALIVRGSIRELKGNQQTKITSSTTETTIVTAAGSGVFADLYFLLVTNTSTTGSKITIKDATAGTTRFVLYAPPTATTGFALIESASHKQATANNNWTATCTTSVADVEFTALFEKRV
jgi:hypothetical protein